MKFNLKIFTNPYYLFSIVWGFCLLFYSFGWARIYPVLTVSVILFVLTAIIIYTGFGFVFQIMINKYSVVNNRIFRVKNLVIFNLIFWLINFAYSGVPLLNIILGRPFDHLVSFGIPSVIVFITSYNGFLCLLCFYYYIKFGEKKYLIYYLICLSLFVSIFSRGSIMLSLTSTFFLWLFVQKKQIKFTRLIVIIMSFLMVLYLFGVAGNYRTKLEVPNYDTDDASGLILDIADASPAFRHSGIPNEFLWSYIYLTSPLGNFQENVDQAHPTLTFENVVAYGVNEYTFDFISKRIQDTFSIPKYVLYAFVPQLSVPTVFAEAYLYIGWLGVIIYALAMLILPIAYFLVVRKFPLWELGMAVICSIYIFSIFDNMFVFSGLSLQLFYPFLFFNGKRKSNLLTRVTSHNKII